jgi:transcriptional repressor NF-X1
LGCEASCIVKQREEQLREAFGIESAAAAAAAAQVKAKTVADIPYDLENIVKVAGMQIKWCLSIEEIFTQFMKNQTAIRYDFKPMITDKRRFIHYLAEAYGLESEAQDPEPFRSVSVRKTITSRVPPMKLFESVKIYQSLRRSTATTTPASSSSVKKEEPCVVKSNAILIKDTIEGTDKELQESIEYLVNPKFQHVHNLHSLKFPEVSASHALKKITDGTDYLLYVPSDVGAARSSIGIEREFTSLLPYLKETLKLNMLANDCQLSLVGASLQVVGQQKKSPGDDDVGDTKPEEEVAVVEKVKDAECAEVEEIRDAVNGINIE